MLAGYVFSAASICVSASEYLPAAIRSRAGCSNSAAGSVVLRAGRAPILPVSPVESLPVMMVLCTGISPPESGLVL
jgi:hypothetical protein